MRLNKNHPLYQEDLDNAVNVKGIAYLKGKSFLITGATGLIGVCLIDSLMKLGGINVYAVGRSKEKARPRLGEYYHLPNFRFIEQDVREPFDTKLKVDFIIPLASNTHPLAYSEFPIETIEINVKGAENALTLAASCNAEVLYPSSVEIYGNARGNDIFTEDYTGQLNLSTSRACYTESKRLAEAMCQSYIAEKRVKCKIARLSRVFGPTMLESDSKASSQFIKKAIAGEDIVLKSKGDQYFSYTYVADAVKALLYILINGENGRAYNVANENCNVHLRDFAKICANEAGKKVVFDLPDENEKKGFSIASQAILNVKELESLGCHLSSKVGDVLKRTIVLLS